ncbi:hypothetical protein DYB28_001398 [Aphanomyces astaci]|uniref:Uncharacterized protein n=1 Tax=Aphanomyces astaci TaxID=112090 RepID=A0A9X8HDC8_APHAT|nr:hypothetical protein DYB28_001398 [Aphanomyces astaci]
MVGLVRTPYSDREHPHCPVSQRLHGAGNFDEWFFELTSVTLAGEDLTEMATHCAQVETATSMKELPEAAALPTGAPPLPPLTLDAHPPLGPELTEWLADNRSTEEAIARSIRNHVDELIKLEKTVIARSCSLVYASLSPTVQRDAAAMAQRDAAAGIRDECAHCIISSLRRKFSSDEQKHATAISVYQRLHTFKFKPHVSLDVNLQAFDKMRTTVEKLEGRPLSDGHLASALLAALPECIAPDLFVWRGAQPSIPYKNMRQLLEQHCPGLVTKYPHYLGPAPIAAAAPVHGSANATATTRSSALALPAFRDGASYGQAATVPWGTQAEMRNP